MKVMLFKNPTSNKPMLNISEMLFCTDTKSMNEAMYWFYAALKHRQKYDPNNLHKYKISLAIFAIAKRDFAEAEKLLLSVSRDLKNTNNYLQVLALERLGKMLNQHFPDRQNEGSGNTVM